VTPRQINEDFTPEQIYILSKAEWDWQEKREELSRTSHAGNEMASADEVLKLAGL